jgi:hypothetical protein
MPTVRRVATTHTEAGASYLRPSPTTGLLASVVTIPSATGWWLERVLDDATVLRWPRVARCAEEADDLEAALVPVPDDHPSWTRS